jgi:fermentation-respiration switch protein FrsA (DUF1100 family)
MLKIIVLFVVLVAGLMWLVRRIEPRFAFFPFAGEDVTPRQLGVDFTPVTIETADGERLRAWHLPRADATAQVVYFHGNGGNLSLWADILVGLTEQRLEVIAVDYRGYGLSTGSPTERGLYQDVDATIDYVNARLRRADLPLIYWGRSIGSAMAAYAASRPSGSAADGVVLEAGFPAATDVFEYNPVMRVLALFSTYRFATAKWMATVKTPALVIHGDRDSVIPYRLGQRLYETLPGPKRFVTIPGGDHNDPAPVDAELYWTAVRDFVQSLTRRP